MSSADQGDNRMQRSQPDEIARYASHGPGGAILDVLPNAAVWARTPRRIGTPSAAPAALSEPVEQYPAGLLEIDNQPGCTEE